DAHAHAAMRLLAATYAHAVSDIDPDTPKGKLWLAPMHLDHRARIGADDSAPARRICLVDAAGRPMPGTLLALRSVPSMRVRPSQWLRTDDEGCLSLSGADATVELHAEGFVVDGSAFAAQLDTQPRDMPLRPRLHRTDGSAVSGRERVVGLPCEDCADILATAPTSFASQASLADLSEPGERLHVSGVVRDRSGHPRAGVILFAYQTDAAGLYHPDPRAGGLPSAQARLRGWVRSDSDGRYRLDTIRPGHYPGRAVPAHIHLHVVEPGRCTWYAGDILFSDDPLLDTTTRAESNRAHGGSGIVDPRRGSDGSWSAERDLMLGLDVAGYEACRATDSS
ncbi:MAG TPA: hypothetical protein PKO41_10550, partial [Dokdonella sp.]|nr:hypothetical protein [Dokdonella sp.]